MKTYKMIFKEDMALTVGQEVLTNLEDFKAAINKSAFALYDVKRTKQGLTAYLNKWTFKLDSKGNRI